MTVNRDSNGHSLAIGDQVTLLGGTARKEDRFTGRGSQGTVKSFGSVHVHVLISKGLNFIDDGAVVPVPGRLLVSGHQALKSAADRLAEAQAQVEASIEKGKQDRAESVLFEVIKLATERNIITEEQGRALWVLQNDIPDEVHDPPAPKG